MERDYILGSDDEELRRLATQHEVWSRSAHRLWDRAGFGAGDAILDLGCGPGYTTIDLARRVGRRGRVVGIDSSRRFVGHLEAQAQAAGAHWVESRHGDVHEVDLEPGAYDGAYARWLLCFVRDPLAVVKRVADTLAPGGSFAVTDYFDYDAFTLAPRTPVMRRVVQAVQESWRRSGGDLDVQGSTPRYMIEAGLEVAHVGSVFEVARPGSPLWNWPRSFFRGFLPKLVEMGLIDEAEARAFEREWDEREADPGAFLCPPPMFDVVGVKPAV